VDSTDSAHPSLQRTTDGVTWNNALGTEYGVVTDAVDKFPQYSFPGNDGATSDKVPFDSIVVHGRRAWEAFKKHSGWLSHVKDNFIPIVIYCADAETAKTINSELVQEEIRFQTAEQRRVGEADKVRIGALIVR